MANLSLRVIAALTWVTLAVTPVIAQDGLYAPRVPEDAALVRVVNLQARDESSRLDVGRERFPALPPGEVGAYRPVPPGIYVLGGAGGVDFSPQAGRFYTIVVPQNAAPAVVTDEVHTDPARAQLVLYNFSDSFADLFAVPGDTVIFEGVQPGRSKAIAVNAIAVAFSVRIAGVVRSRREIELERGESYGIFVGREQVVVSPATVSPE